jgi:hypothetical protein
MYPSIMATMPDLRYCPRRIQSSELHKYKRPKYVRIFCIDELVGVLKKNFIPTWYDNTTKEFTASPYIEKGIDKPYYIFEEELEEMQKWYDLEYSMNECIVIKTDENLYKKFVDRFYKIKSESRISNPCLFQFSKLCLNSAYGKLAQNPRRLDTHRELNEDGAVRLVADEWKIDEDSTLNVIVGAYVTARARIKLLTAIRDICGNVAKNFVYCDTDSIHSRVPYANTSNTELGGWKFEGCFEHSKYLSPKTYFNMNGEVGDLKEFFLHTKGVPQKYIYPMMEGKTLKTINKTFSPGVLFPALMGLNIKGGKALIPCKKEICKIGNSPVQDTELFFDEIEDVEKKIPEKINRSKFL